MRILITGGMGFLGKAVVRRLLQSPVASITILDNLLPKIHGPAARPPAFGDERVSFCRGDVTRRADMEPLLTSADSVLHLAAETGTGQSMYEVEHYCQVNIAATALMLDILSNKRHSVKKLVVASSRAIYGEGQYRCAQHGQVYPEMRLLPDLDRGDFEVKCPTCRQPVDVEPTAETARSHPSSFYGITKQTQESIVMTLCPPLGIAPTALRYQNVYGPGQSLPNPYTGILSIFSNRIRAGKAVNVFEDGRESRDFVFIDDVAEATTHAILSDRANGEVFNVGSGIPISILEVASKLRECFRSQVEVRVSGQYRAGDIRHNYADLTRIKAVLGWQPHTTFEQGLALFVDWVKSQALTGDLSDQALTEMHEKGLFRSSEPARTTRS